MTMRRIKFLLLLLVLPVALPAQETMFSEDLPIILDVAEITEKFKGKWYEYKVNITQRERRFIYDYKLSNKKLTARAVYHLSFYASRPYYKYTGDKGMPNLTVLSDPPKYENKKINRFGRAMLDEYKVPRLAEVSEDERYFFPYSDYYEQGDGFIAFLVVDENGKSKIEVAKESRLPDFDDRILEIIASSGDWKPGTYQGKPVETTYVVVFYAQLEYKGWTIKLIPEYR